MDWFDVKKKMADRDPDTPRPETDALRTLLRALIWCLSEVRDGPPWWVDFETLRDFLRDRDVAPGAERADVCVRVDGSTQRRALRAALMRCLDRHEGFGLETVDADRCRLCYRGTRICVHQYIPGPEAGWLECRSRPQSRIRTATIGEPVLLWWSRGAAFVPIPEHAADVLVWRYPEGPADDVAAQEPRRTVYGELLQGWMAAAPATGS